MPTQIFYLGLILCLHGSHPCKPQVSAMPIKGLDACLSLGHERITKWNREKTNGGWFAIGELCNDDKPPAEE